MKTEQHSAEVNIHLRARARARAHDRALIDRAAALVGSNRSQFMLASALKESKNVILDQSTFHVDNKAFNHILDLLDSQPTQEQIDGINRLLVSPLPWSRD